MTNDRKTIAQISREETAMITSLLRSTWARNSSVLMEPKLYNLRLTSLRPALPRFTAHCTEIHSSSMNRWGTLHMICRKIYKSRSDIGRRAHDRAQISGTR